MLPNLPRQRKYETDIRRAKDLVNALKAAGDDIGARHEQKRVHALNKEYRAFSEHVGLSMKTNRTHTIGSIRNFGVKSVELPNEFVAAKELPQDIKNAVVRDLDDVQSKYNVRIDEISYRRLSPDEGKVPLQFYPMNDNGKLKMLFVINKGFDWNDRLDAFNERIYNKNYLKGMLASKNITGLIYHEMAHFMSFQDCDTWQDFLSAERLLRRKFVAGISGYADLMEDGAESVAEAFVRTLNGESVSDDAKRLVDDYIMRWRK